MGIFLSYNFEEKEISIKELEFSHQHIFKFSNFQIDTFLFTPQNSSHTRMYCLHSDC